MKGAFGCMFWVAAIVLGGGAALKLAFFEIAVVQHNAMAPTIVEGEQVLVFKRGEPKLNSIAVCAHPDEEGLVVGRVAAIEGIEIESQGQKLYVDDERIDFDKRGAANFYDVGQDTHESLDWGYEYLAGDAPHLVFMSNEGGHRIRQTLVESGEVYLLGDNRAYFGHDSRGFGVVDADTCIGTVIMRVTAVDGLRGELAHGNLDLLE